MKIEEDKQILDQTAPKEESLDDSTKRVTEFKSNRLFFILGGFFLANAFIAEFIGVKIFSLEGSLGIAPLGLDPMGGDGPLNFTAGVLLWPVVFIMTDVINEYFGVSGVRFLSVLAASLIAYAFVMIFAAIGLAPADWWVEGYTNKGIPDMQAAFRGVFGQGMWIIVGSLVAFLVGQIVDAIVFRGVKKQTGNNRIWIRATVSTMVSQLIDSYLVLYIAFVLGADWSMEMLFSIGTANYIYKVLVAILFIPILYFIHNLIDRYLGEDVSNELKELALNKN
ncbi:queuosine precursor transporter [Aureispira anguillae]|uniref:Probable queuosine precursor transporter n=1 Tax=Aureispira anguillae TaxID=2864201 RepID=A0A915YEU3_9BACT|nr:queuosine precursor transporter [Aureispira anguillae]BDS11730.1 queuosine precursor transporter [Aureispira anguillae]